MQGCSKAVLIHEWGPCGSAECNVLLRAGTNPNRFFLGHVLVAATCMQLAQACVWGVSLALTSTIAFNKCVANSLKEKVKKWPWSPSGGLMKLMMCWFGTRFIRLFLHALRRYAQTRTNIGVHIPTLTSLMLTVLLRMAIWFGLVNVGQLLFPNGIDQHLESESCRPRPRLCHGQTHKSTIDMQSHNLQYLQSCFDCLPNFTRANADWQGNR